MKPAHHVGVLLPAFVLLTACDAPVAWAPVPASNDASGGAHGSTKALDLGPIQRAPNPGPPVAGGTLAVADWDGARVAVASDPDGDRVWMVDLDARKVVATVALQPGDEPGRVVVSSADRRAYVLLRRGGAVAILDSSGSVLARTPVCPAPRGLDHDPVDHTLIVACLDGALVTLPDDGGDPIRTVQLDDDLRDVVLDPATGETFVSRFRSAEVLIVDPDGSVEERAKLPTFDGFVPEVAWRMVAVPGGVLIAHQRGSGGAVDISSPDGYGGGEATCGGIVHSAISTIGGGAARSSAALGGTLPVDVAVDRTTSRVALAFAAIEVRVPDGSGGAAPPPSDPCVGGTGPAPRAIRFGSHPADQRSLDPPDPTTLAVTTADVPGQAVAVAFGSDGVLVEETRHPLALTWDGSPLVLDSQDAKADTGDAFFHLDSGGGIACASCHPEGGDDGRVWHFERLGARRTMSLRGGMLGSGPFHWNGSLRDFPALVNEVFVHRMGGAPPFDEQVTALRRYLDTMPSPPASAAPDADAVARGKALFESDDVGCASCHEGPRRTNDAIVDVGTGDGPLKVPVLHDLAHRAPYMHNGCAATLADRFGPCGGDEHGNASSLTTDQIDDLVAYLATL